MPSCQRSRADARAFVITPYVEGPGGRLVAKVPSEGPCRELDGVACRLVIDHHRSRKTGPEFPLAVLRCGRHGRRAFTAYPPGYVPYGRQRMAPVAVDGSAVQIEGTDGVEAYATTVFGAALDAARGRAWSRDGWGPWWSVQGRWLERLVRWVGVAADLDAQVRGALAALLVVAELVLREQAARIAAHGGYRERGRGVVAVLERLGGGASVADRLVAAGAEVGLWPRALRWHAEVKRLRAVPFRGRAARSPPRQ